MSYPYQQQYPSQPVQGQPPTGGVQPQQWGGQQPPAAGQWGQPAAGGPPQQWGQPQPATGGGQPPQQQWGGQPQGYPGGGGGQPQHQWGQPQPATGGGQPPQQPGTGYPGQAGAGGPPPQGQQQPPGSYQPPPTQPPSNFQGWEMQQVRQWFMSMDRDRSGSISANELANVAIGGVPIGFETAVKLIRVFDVDKNGTIDFYEYGALHKALFQQQDRDRNGRLDANEIGAALSAGGFRLGPVATQSMFRKYNKSGYGISTVEFLGLVAHVAQVKSLFEWRDKQKTGQVTLDMDSLLEITSDF
ncbi:EF hand domain containing protein [Acanthamoeba castellanii str. Neff]|uniref:EF hand domain containing protein n=1 Tax=Acanthamoeba castellanii (strain ATCC 30010 / Neff) TaxID=1257118 RepID=L8HE62_ACACF|nr:EF hand domain containing protein [Acanthamoeba castellanii str. Neff]ELR23517.1 EF hand domain containing protein [Acanthamoeba castellanii str. Neff]